MLDDSQLKVVQEADALRIKFNDLNKFVCSLAFEDLTNTHQQLLRRQHVAMRMYLDVLQERIDLFSKLDYNS